MQWVECIIIIVLGGGSHNAIELSIKQTSFTDKKKNEKSCSIKTKLYCHID